jgi:hypothetical protein
VVLDSGDDGCGRYGRGHPLGALFYSPSPERTAFVSSEFLSQGGSSVGGAATPGPSAEVETLSPEPTRRRAAKRKRPHCKTCDRAIYVPLGWSQGAAVRRHYWERHRAVMRADSGR